MVMTFAVVSFSLFWNHEIIVLLSKSESWGLLYSPCVSLDVTKEMIEGSYPNDPVTVHVKFKTIQGGFERFFRQG